MSSEETINILRDSLTTFGTPSRVITDRATNFANEAVTNLFRQWNIEHHLISTGTPRANGQVECYVTTIINMLSTTCNNEAEWPSSLCKVQQSLNTTIQKSTGFSPMRLLIGRDGNIPCIQARLSDIGEQALPNSEHVNDTTSEDRRKAYDMMKTASERSKSRFDKTRRDNKEFSTGDTVYVSQDHRRHSKLSPKYKGPYQIIEVMNNDRFRLQGRGRLHDITVAKEKLRLWPGEWSEENVLMEAEILNSDNPSNSNCQDDSTSN